MKDNKKSKKDKYQNHLFPADFEHFDFEKLENENKNAEYKGILWKNGSFDKKHNKPKTDLKIDIGDTVYIFYSNLPDRIDRILLKCTVKDTYGNNKNCFYYQTNEEKVEIEQGKRNKIPAILLEYENAINVKNNKEEFSRENLKKYDISKLQGKQHLKEDLDNQNKLIEDLEKASKKKKCDITELKNYMNDISKCALDGKLFDKDIHKTFAKDNGLNYYEKHHLIEQCNGNNEKFPKEIINNKINIINLCSNCHNRIHNGKKEDRKKMVEKLYKMHDEEYNELIRKANVKPGDELKWLLKQYGIDE